MLPDEAARLLEQAEEAAAATAVEECLGLLAQVQEGTDAAQALTPALRGTALALEAFCKDLLAAEDGFLQRYLDEVLEQVRPGVSFLEGLARTLARLGRAREARALTEELARRIPGDWQVQLDLALLRLADFAPEPAGEALRRLQDAAPASESAAIARLIRDADPDDLLHTRAALHAALSPDAKSHDAFIAAWREISVHDHPALAADLLQRAASDTQFRHPALWPLLALALLLSPRPFHSRRAIRRIVLETDATPPARHALRAIQHAIENQPSERDVELAAAVQAALLEPENQRDTTIEWLLELARLVLARAAGNQPDGDPGEFDTYRRLLREVLAAGMVTAPVLRAWNHAASGIGPQSQPAPDSLFLVRLVIEGTSPRHASDAPDQPAPVGERVLPFAVAYEIAVPATAEPAALRQAAEVAMELEQTLGARTMAVASESCRGIPPNAIARPYGIRRRSGRIFFQADGADAS